MTATTAYFLFRVIVALVLGAVFYVVDRRLGVRLYRWWYNLTHEHPMTGDSPRGFVYNRRSKVRATWAVLIATLVTVLSFLNGAFYPLLELGLWAASVPAAFAGLVIGPRLHGLWQQRDTAFNAVDKWERGEVDLSDELKARTTEMGSRLKGRITSVPDAAAPDATAAPGAPAAVPGEPSAASAAPAAPGVPEKAPPPAEGIESQDPQELVNRYLRRGQGGPSGQSGQGGPGERSE